MADIGEDGTTTVRKLEGFQIRLPASQAMLSIRLAIVLHAHTTDRPSHFLAPSRISIDHVGNTQRTGEYALEGREETPTAKARRP
jgi:hypothetical protein